MRKGIAFKASAANGLVSCLFLLLQIFIVCAGIRSAPFQDLPGGAPNPPPCGRATLPANKNWKLAPCNPAAEPATEGERALRKARGALFDDDTGGKKPLDLPSSTPGIGYGRSPGVPRILEPLPAAESDIVVVGRVGAFQPYFSNDRTKIYHELTLRVESVLKRGSANMGAGGTIVIMGEGGSIRLPDGRVVTDFIPPPAENDIRLDGRYVLFLLYSRETDSFRVLKAWRLQAGHAVPLAASDIRAAKAGVSPYADMDESSFLIAVENAVKHPKDR